MTDISVNGIKKSFEIGNNLLDGITFQVEAGERVVLLTQDEQVYYLLCKVVPL